MRDNYIDLCCFNFGKRSYVIMKNNFKIMFFEKVDNKYEMPILSFNLSDNVGKSLTVVNQNFFMSQLINRLNIAFNKGILSKDKEIVEYLNVIKVKAENDIYLKKLFKGSLMKEIDDINFEFNKREIIKYLDNFKIGMFASYNNVSIFNGSIEKNSSLNSDSKVVNSDVVSAGSSSSYNIDDFDFSTDRFNDVSVSNIQVDVPKNVVQNVENIKSNDVVQSIQEQSAVNNIQERPVFQPVQEQPLVQSVQEQPVVQPVQESLVVNNVQEKTIVQNNSDVQSENTISSNDYFNSLKNNTGSNISYINDVKKRLENNL